MRMNELMAELNFKFAEIKRELGLKYALEDYDRIFYIKDLVLSARFVSDSFSRMLCSRVVDTYNSWMGFLNSVLIPNPAHIQASFENQLLSEDEKDEVLLLMAKISALTSLNSYVGLSKDKPKEKEFLDTAIDLWDGEVKDFLIKMQKRSINKWNERARGIANDRD